MLLKLKLPPEGNRKIDPKSCYKLYLQYKSHFNGRYDLVAYNWRMSVSDKSFDKRRDKFFFKKLSDQYTLQQLSYILVSNLSSNQDSWIGDISDSDAITHYKQYVSRLRTLSGIFETDVKSVYLFYTKLDSINKFKDLFVYNDKIKTSYILKLLQTKIITLESFMLLDSLFNIIDELDTHPNIVWDNYSVRLKAYKKLLIINKPELVEQFKSILVNLKSIKK